MNSKKFLTMSLMSAVLVIAAVTVSRGEPGKNVTPADPKQAVLARLNEIQAAAQALDVDKVFSFVLENDNGALIQNGQLQLTRTEALNATRQGFKGLEKMSYQFDRQQVTLLSPTLALAIGEGSSTGTTLDGRTFSTRFAQSVVLMLTNGQWMVYHAHRSFPAAR